MPQADVLAVESLSVRVERTDMFMSTSRVETGAAALLLETAVI